MTTVRNVARPSPRGCDSGCAETGKHPGLDVRAIEVVSPRFGRQSGAARPNSELPQPRMNVHEKGRTTPHGRMLMIEHLPAVWSLSAVSAAQGCRSVRCASGATALPARARSACSIAPRGRIAQPTAAGGGSRARDRCLAAIAAERAGDRQPPGPAGLDCRHDLAPARPGAP